MKIKVQNKWNHNIYTVDDEEILPGGKVRLIRTDGTKFEIQLSEYRFNYFEVEKS